MHCGSALQLGGIRSSFAGATGVAAGLPPTVTPTLVDTNASCTHLAGCMVCVWHCDRAGLYLLYPSRVTGENHLRGMQATDSNGQVTFTPIFPACCSGRWPRIHFEVYPGLALATSVSHVAKALQTALPQSACDAVFATTGYSTRASKLSRITLASDMVFSDGAALELPTITGSVAADDAIALTVGVAAQARERGLQARASHGFTRRLARRGCGAEHRAAGIVGAERRRLQHHQGHRIRQPDT
ncbi:MAG: hypothetical protein H7306_07050, partial [Bacteriovorax sp.]|nr:hypothetical protein [Rhizobacter sp.]